MTTSEAFMRDLYRSLRRRFPAVRFQIFVQNREFESQKELIPEGAWGISAHIRDRELPGDLRTCVGHAVVEFSPDGTPRLSKAWVEPWGLFGRVCEPGRLLEDRVDKAREVAHAP